MTDLRRIWKQLSTVSLLTMLSRLFGFVRDLIFANAFGASAAFDAFLVAFRLPNLFRSLFAEGAFSQAFVPALAAQKEQGDAAQLKRFIAAVSGLLLLVLLLLVLIVECIAPQVIQLMAPGFQQTAGQLSLAAHLLRLTFPYLIFISMVALIAAVLHVHKRFFAPAFAPIILNIVFILVVTLIAQDSAQPMQWCALAVLLAGIFQLCWMMPFWQRLGLMQWPRWDWQNTAMRRVIALMLPAMLGVSVFQLGIFIDNWFASYLAEGSISWLYYTSRLTFLPLGVLGVAISTVVLPHLSQQHAQSDTTTYQRTLSWACQLALLLGVPAALGLIFLSGPILVTLIYRGAFGVHDVLMTQRSLITYAMGLPAFMLIKVLASAFYSRQNMARPAVLAAVSLVVNVGLNILLVTSMQHAGLALASSIAAWCNALMLLFSAIKYGVFRLERQQLISLFRIFIAGSCMVVFIVFCCQSLEHWLAYSLKIRIVYLFSLIFAGMGLYFLVLRLLGLRFKQLKPAG